MNITIYSTCQGAAIQYYLKKYFYTSANFNLIQNYFLILNKNPSELTNFRKILSTTSIFIYQEIHPKYDVYSTDTNIENNILSFLPQNCKKIVIPYIYADWLWGINVVHIGDGTANFDIINNNYANTKYINKEVILSLKKKYNLDTILKLYDNNELNLNYVERKKYGINILKNKEKTCDIKLSDFILNNYQKYKLFTTPNHPTYLVLQEMVRQIIIKLNIDSPNFYDLIKNDKFHLNPPQGCPTQQEIGLQFSKYDINFHKFEFDFIIEDDKIKEIIIDLYNS